MSESDLYAPILSAWSRGASRLWRQNSGFAWQGTVIEHTPTRLILAHPRALRMGAPGMSDLGGFIGVEVTPQMVGSIVAVYSALELKSGRRRATPEQAAFIALVRKYGGRAGVARSVSEAGQILAGIEL